MLQKLIVPAANQKKKNKKTKKKKKKENKTKQNQGSNASFYIFTTWSQPESYTTCAIACFPFSIALLKQATDCRLFI